MSCLAERFIYLPLFYLVLEEQKASTVLIGTADGAVVEVVLNFANLLGFEKGHQQLKFFGTQRSISQVHKELHKSRQKTENYL